MRKCCGTNELDDVRLVCLEMCPEFGAAIAYLAGSILPIGS